MWRYLKHRTALIMALTLLPFCVQAQTRPTISKALAALCGLSMDTMSEDDMRGCLDKLAQMSQEGGSATELAQKVIMDDKEESSEEALKQGWERLGWTGEFEENVIDEKVQKEPPTTSRDDSSITGELLKTISQTVNSLIATASSRMAMDLMASYNDTIERNLVTVAEQETESGAEDYKAPEDNPPAADTSGDGE